MSESHTLENRPIFARYTSYDVRCVNSLLDFISQNL